MTRTALMKDVDGYTVHKRLVRGQDYYLWYKIYKAGYRGYNLQEHLYKMRDDKEAMARRTFQVRWNGFIIKRHVMKDFKIPFATFLASKDLFKALIPSFLMKQIRKYKMK